MPPARAHTAEGTSALQAHHSPSGSQGSRATSVGPQWGRARSADQAGLSCVGSHGQVQILVGAAQVLKGEQMGVLELAHV